MFTPPCGDDIFCPLSGTSIDKNSLHLKPIPLILHILLVSSALVFALTTACSKAPAPTTSAVGGRTRADSLLAYRYEAKTSRQKGQYGEAAKLYEKVIEYNPGDQKAHYFLATCLLKLERQRAAKEAFIGSAALDSSHWSTNLALTQIYLNEGKADSASHFLRHMARVKPASPRVRQLRRQLADQFRLQGGIATSVHHYAQLAESATDPREKAELFGQLANLQRDAGDAEAALTWRRKLLQLRAQSKGDSLDQSATLKHIAILSDTVELLVEAGDAAEAYRILRELVELDPRSSYAYYHRMAELAAERNDRPEQLEGLEGMARAHPNDMEAVATLAEFHLTNRELAAAAKWLRRGLDVSPDRAHFHLLMGDLLVLNGDETEALMSFEKAKNDALWEDVAQQRIWQIRPPETTEEKLKREFFGSDGESD